MRHFKSLKAKLIFNIILILVICIAANLVIGITASYSGLEKNAASDLKAIGNMAQVAVSNSLNNLKEGINAVAALGDIGGNETLSSTASWMSVIEKKKSTYGYKELYVADKSGQILSTDTTLMGKNIADTEYFKKAMNGDTYISTTMKNVKGDLVIFLSAPVSNNKYTGVVVAELDCQTYSNLIKNIVIGETGNVFIIDKDANMIANKRPQLVADRKNFIEEAKNDSKYASAAAVYEKMKAGQTGVDKYSYDNGVRLCYYQPLEGTDGWSCGVVAPIQEMTSSIKTTALEMGITSAVLIILGVFVTIFMSKSIAAPIRACAQRLKLLAQGDLQSEVPVVTAKDETGELAQATATLISDLREVVRDETYLLGEMSKGNFNISSDSTGYLGDFLPLQKAIMQIIETQNDALSHINHMAEQVASASGQVSSGAQVLSQGATEQASSIEELSATIANISEQVKRNAKHAKSADGKAQKVGADLEVCSQQMKALIDAMAEIRNSSDQISKIIKTIEDIAFQTNILALNAAVEAARAGTAGKGFAVVADEVRNLASKSAEASKDTSVLIENSLNAVENGTKIADDTAKFLLDVVEGAKDILSSVNKISDASGHQAEAIDQVTLGIEQISAVVQTNSATAEESAAASEELSGQAQTMKELINKFQLKNSTDIILDENQQQNFLNEDVKWAFDEKYN